eukprot:TRINITY_DN62687_c0_g1_i1.p1 TRINITY_DN62687_c0_g1~~TRINITY_DN62687_c0_g1_i1.p1  ORF type:complete len:359 (+),score=36.08 TRINITY_DN62687_c0_g1_i1:86-1078(+)
MSTPREATKTISSEGATAATLHPVHSFAGHTVKCTCDEKLQADLLGGHTWNIINNSDKHEIYMRHARDSRHFVDEQNRATNRWFEKKRPIGADRNGSVNPLTGSNVQEAMVCPGTAGKEASYLKARQAKQLCQSMSPRDYEQYRRQRQASSAAPPTPGRVGQVDRQVPFRGRLRDVAVRPSPRVVDRQQWTPRRGEPQAKTPAPPNEQDMFRTVDQLRAESHMDVADRGLAENLLSARPRHDLSVLADVSTARSTVQHSEQLPPKSARDRVHHSTQRVEESHAREITGWPFHRDAKTKRGDHFYCQPVQQSGSSSVKFDIISGERKQFWY